MHLLNEIFEDHTNLYRYNYNYCIVKCQLVELSNNSVEEKLKCVYVKVRAGNVLCVTSYIFSPGCILL